MRTLLPLLCFLAAHGADHPFAGESFTSTSDGLLLTYVADDGQAAKLGIVRGDVLVSYGGEPVPSMEALRMRVDASIVDAEVDPPKTIEVVVLRAGEAVPLRVAPGKLGVAGDPVAAGVELRFVPPARPMRFALDPLRAQPIDTWGVFTIDGVHVGYEHTALRLDGDVLHAFSEVAFTHEKWGTQHFIQHDRVGLGGERPAPLWLRHASADGAWSWESEAVAPATWRSRETVDGAATPHEAAIGALALQDYVAAGLPLIAVAEPEACLHFRMLIASDPGESRELKGLVCRGEAETTLRDGSSARAMRWDTVGLGKVVRTLWVRDGRAIRHDYGAGTIGWPGATREEALAGVAPEMAPVATP